MLIRYENRLIVPIVHEDGSLEARPYKWTGESDVLNDELRFNHNLFPFLLVHADVPVETVDEVKQIIHAKLVDIRMYPQTISRFSTPNHLKEQIIRQLRSIHGLKHDFEITELETEGATALFYQSTYLNRMKVGFDYRIIHNEDFDKDCMVCTESTEVLHTVLGEWLNEAILVEQDWQEQEHFKIKDTSKIIILPPPKTSDEPLAARLLAWFCKNFEETIKLASVERIRFCEYGVNISYDQVIDYASVV